MVSCVARSLVLSILIAFTAAAPAFAENNAGPVVLSPANSKSTWDGVGSPVRLIPTLGVAVTSLKGDSSAGNNTGLSGGLLIDAARGAFSFESGLLFAQFGGADTVFGQTLQMNLNYVAIPLVAKFNFMGNPDQTVFLKAGLMPMALVSSSATFPGGGSSSVSAKSVDAAAIVGVGGAFPVSGNNSVIVDASYVRGLTNVSDSVPVHNEGFVLSAGFSIGMD